MVDLSQEKTSPDAQGKAQVSGGTSRFSRFGFGSQLLQKTVGLVLRPRPGKQVSLVVYILFCFPFLLNNTSDCAFSNCSHSALYAG